MSNSTVVAPQSRKEQDRGKLKVKAGIISPFSIDDVLVAGGPPGEHFSWYEFLACGANGNLPNGNPVYARFPIWSDPSWPQGLVRTYTGTEVIFPTGIDYCCICTDDSVPQIVSMTRQGKGLLYNIHLHPLSIVVPRISSPPPYSPLAAPVMLIVVPESARIEAQKIVEDYWRRNAAQSSLGQLELFIEQINESNAPEDRYFRIYIKRMLLAPQIIMPEIFLLDMDSRTCLLSIPRLAAFALWRLLMGDDSVTALEILRSIRP